MWMKKERMEWNGLVDFKEEKTYTHRDWDGDKEIVTFNLKMN